jgi:DNA-binding SARP family transcriptional activator
MPGQLEGSDNEEGALSPAPAAEGASRTGPPPGHLEETEWSRLLVDLAAGSLLPNEMPLAWLLGPDQVSAFCEAGRTPPSPFAPGPDGATWTVPRSAAGVDSLRREETPGSPLPGTPPEAALVTLWEAGGARCLLDLLTARSVALDGPPIAVGFTIADLVVELASTRWASPGEVYLVGISQELRGLGTVKFLADAGEAVALLNDLNAHNENRPTCLVVAPGTSGARAQRELRQLLATAEQLPRTGVVCCDTSARTRCTWHLASHHHTVRLEVRRRSGLSAVLTPERWVELAAPATTPTAALAPPPAGLRFAESAATSETPEHGPHSQGEAGGVEISFLGPVRVTGAGENLERRRRLTELIVYVAFHPEGVTGEAIATALWPERLVPRQTVANRLHEARLALGVTAEGEPRMRRTGGRHMVGGDVRTDWGRFCSLTGAGSGPRSWHQALSLVRGRPFDGLSQGDWVTLEGAAVRIEARIGEVAVRLGEHMLGNGDAVGASWAARQAIAGVPWDERLYRLLMRAADASGSRGAVESALRWLAQSLDWDGDPLRAVHPATVALYRELTGLPAGAEAAAAPLPGSAGPQ